MTAPALSARYLTVDVKEIDPEYTRGFAVHTVGYVPDGGWVCSCGKTRCAHLAYAREWLREVAR